MYICSIDDVLDGMGLGLFFFILFNLIRIIQRYLSYFRELYRFHFSLPT